MLTTTLDTSGNDLPAKRVYPVIARDSWATALVFMLSLSLTGLLFYPALLVAFAMMVRAYRQNRYDCLIMSLLFFGSYGMTAESDMPVKPIDICVIISFALFLLFEKAPIVKTTLAVFLGYAALFFCFAFFSDETLKVQVLTWRRCLGFAFFIIPIVLFSRKEFKLMDFWNRLMPYVLIACIFYILDAFIFSGNLLMPGTATADTKSTFFDPYAAPLSFRIFRKYPQGLFPLFLLIYPIARYYKLRLWQWLLIGVALLSTQTFTVLSAVLFTYVLFRFGLKHLLAVILICILSFVATYFIDGLLPERKNEYNLVESKLRIKSSIDQFINLYEAVDEEDLAMFASGRFAQVLPRVEMISNEHRQLTGLGFLHPEKNTVKRYEIVNELYLDISQSEEVIAEVEIVPVQIYIWAGWLGLILHCIFLFALYWIIRRLRGYAYFLSILFCCIITGLGAFAGLINAHGILLAATAFSAVILANRDKLTGFPPVHS